MKLIERQRERALRKSKLFTDAECEALRGVPREIPYFKTLLKDRKDLNRECKKAGTKLIDSIKLSYDVKGWTKNGKPDPFKMLRHYQDIHKQRYPDYESPWEKKPRRRISSREFAFKIDRTKKRLGYSNA